MFVQDQLSRQVVEQLEMLFSVVDCHDEVAGSHPQFISELLIATRMTSLMIWGNKKHPHTSWSDLVRKPWLRHPLSGVDLIIQLAQAPGYTEARRCIRYQNFNVVTDQSDHFKVS